MFKEIRKLKRHTKRHSFLVQGTTILSLLAVLHAYTCRGGAARLLDMQTSDFMAMQPSPQNFQVIVDNTTDISLLVPSKDKHKPRSFLYATVLSGILEKVKIVLQRLVNDTERNIKHKNENFQNLPDESSGKTPLTKSIEMGDILIVSALVSSTHIDVTSVDNEKRSPLHMAAICNREQAFSLIWNKLLTQDPTKTQDQNKDAARQSLFQKDKKDHSVFASAYLPEPGLFGSNANLKMFKYILGIVKESLQETDFKEIDKEIGTLQHKKEIGNKYAGKLRNEISLIQHPPAPTQNKKPETEEKK